MHLVKAQNFEGPLGLLLELVEKRKMAVSEVSLAEIASQYLERVRVLGQFPAHDTASFIETASILLLIKSRYLIPSLVLTAEEEQNIGDLEKRLRIYKFVRELSAIIKNSYGKNPMFGREPFLNVETSGALPRNVSLEEILRAVKRVAENLPQVEKLPEARIFKIIKLEEKMTELISRINGGLSVCFGEFCKSRTGGKEAGSEKEQALKTEMIVSFLAMLELIKQGLVVANQENLFDNIQINARA